MNAATAPKLPTVSSPNGVLKCRSVAVHIGQIAIGGGAPIVVQSMTDTNTADVAATVRQVRQLALAGAELVRITVNDDAAARAVPKIRELLDTSNCTVPLVGDFHYNGDRLLAAVPECAIALAKYRINPGNVGFGENQDRRFAAIVEQALLHSKVIRIGVNWGSLDQALLQDMMDKNANARQPLSSVEVMREALVQSALKSAQLARDLGLGADRIILSSKVSEVQSLVAVYRKLAGQCSYPLHLGLTEAGMGSKGIVASSTAMAILLQEGIGDTIRVSLTPAPGEERTREVQVAQEILQTMGLRSFTPMVTACPGCGRTSSSLFRELADSVQSHVRKRMPEWRLRYPGVEDLSLAVMGCVVNGPGESRYADIGISLPGRGESPAMPVFIDGEKNCTLRGENITAEFLQLIENYVSQRYGGGKQTAADD